MTFLSILLVLLGSLLWLAFGIQSLYLLFIERISSDQLFKGFLTSNYNYQFLLGLLLSIEFLIIIQVGSRYKNDFVHSEFLVTSIIWLVLGLVSFVVSFFMILSAQFFEEYFFPVELLSLVQSSTPFIIIYCVIFVLLIFYRFTKRYEGKVHDLSIHDKVTMDLLFISLGLVGGTLAGVLVLTGSFIMIFDVLSQKFLFV